MNLQKFEKAGRWLFGFTLVGGMIMSTSGVELLPAILGIIFLTALAGFPNFWREIRWRRVFLFSVMVMLVAPGMYYWAVWNKQYDPVAVFCYWAALPLVDYDPRSGLSLADWLPFWVMNGMLYGFVIESFCALSKQRGIKNIEVCLRRDSERQGDVPPFGLAGISCLGCLAVVFFAVQFLTYSGLHFMEGLLPAFFIGPLATAFAVLYRSSWQRELPARRRVAVVAWRSVVIFGVVSIVILLMGAVLMILVMSGGLGTFRPRGEYCAFN
jgi:hypothetical protein